MGKTLQNTDQLTAAFKYNDQKVMQMVYQNTFPKFRSHVLKNSGDEAQAKDVFQEAFISCWRNIKEDRATKNSNVEAYLFAIAKNKWTDYLRSSQFKNTVVSNTTVNLSIVVEDEPSNQKIVKEKQLSVLQKALGNLGINCKNLLQLFYFERKSMDTISKELNITSASARNQKYRCMEKLRRLSLEIDKNG